MKVMDTLDIGESMSRKHRKYTEEFKAEALRLLETTDRSAAAIEQELGITQGLLSRWKRKKDQGKSISTTPSNGESQADQIKRLERENEILRQERDILKKAMAIFSNPRG